MFAAFPFLSAYDPPGVSEGTIDPLGLYQIADQLAVHLVPAVRERMQRVRFLTAMAVGALVTEGLENDPTQRDASPYLVWEWFVVQAIVRELNGERELKGVAGRHISRRAIDQHGYLDARSYLKTPRIFGFHGVYKRLAVHLGLVDVHLGPGSNAEKLADAWARGQDLAGLSAAKPLFTRWQVAVRKGLYEKPPRAKPGWNSDTWRELAQAFAPASARAKEKRVLQELLLNSNDRPLGALPELWDLQANYHEDSFDEAELHNRLEKRRPIYRPLLQAIRLYESFARALLDAFDVLKAEAARPDAQGFVVTEIALDSDFKRSVKSFDRRFERAYAAFGDLSGAGLAIQNLFADRFRAFAEPMDGIACARALCEHHVAVQRAKSANGKRPWFDRLGPDRIYVRPAYREPRREIYPDHYVHDYRGRPIGRFRADLS
jgi:hypothetical protein